MLQRDVKMKVKEIARLRQQADDLLVAADRSAEPMKTLKEST